MFCRKCQECGHIQESKPPLEYKSDVWRETKCKKCKSVSLDYGSEGYARNAAGKLAKLSADEDD